MYNITWKMPPIKNTAKGRLFFDFITYYQLRIGNVIYLAGNNALSYGSQATDFFNTYINDEFIENVPGQDAQVAWIAEHTQIGKIVIESKTATVNVHFYIANNPKEFTLTLTDDFGNSFSTVVQQNSNWATIYGLPSRKKYNHNIFGNCTYLDEVWVEEVATSMSVTGKVHDAIKANKLFQELSIMSEEEV